MMVDPSVGLVKVISTLSVMCFGSGMRETVVNGLPLSATSTGSMRRTREPSPLAAGSRRLSASSCASSAESASPMTRPLADDAVDGLRRSFWVARRHTNVPIRVTRDADVLRSDDSTERVGGDAGGFVVQVDGVLI